MVINGLPFTLFERYLLKTIENTHNILDIGTSHKFSKELKTYEALLKERGYVAAGYQPSLTYGEYNCDCHQDIEKMSFMDNAFESILCLEVLEHVKNPFQAVHELKRVLTKEGRLLLSVPFLTQYHGKGNHHSHESYPDFWRFTHEGLRELFQDFHHIEIVPLDGPIEFRLKQFYLGKYIDRFGLLRWFVDAIDTPRLGKATSRHLLFGIK